MTIEEMKKALMSGKDSEALIKEFNAQLKQAQTEVAAEKEKNIKLDTARRKLALAIADYAEALYGENNIEIDAAEINVLLKAFEEEQEQAEKEFFNKFTNYNRVPKKYKNCKKDCKEEDDESLDDLFDVFFKLNGLK
jgi:hypothetical protein